MDIGEQAAKLVKPCSRNFEKLPRPKMRWNVISVKCIQHDGVKPAGARRKKILAVLDVANNLFRQAKIAAGQDESVRVHIDDRDFAAGTRQHRSERTATTADRPRVAISTA